jgi:starch phosphorylase
MVSFVRQRLKMARLAQGASMSDVQWCESVLDPKVLTIGFARRFATYKRATLLLSQPDRLRNLLLSPDKPVQFVFAGKAHPADDLGKKLIQQIHDFSHELQIRHRFVFIDDYEIAVARALYQGCDVWLNTPRRPQEACGTSGMKAALNGALNCSILDGWWDECFDGSNGWAISSVESITDLAARDEREAHSLFDLLENQIAPMFWVRSEGPVPRRWMVKVTHSLATLGPFVTANRMVRDYVTTLYEPAAIQSDRTNANDAAAAKALSAWEQRIFRAWPEVAISGVSTDTDAAELGATRSVNVTVHLGSLGPDDVAVQLLHGPVSSGDELVGPQVVTLTPIDGGSVGTFTYQGTFSCEAAGRYGLTLRVLATHPDLATPVALGRIVWG